MRILITGGLGFIGSHLVDRFKKDHEVFIYDDFSNVCVEYYLQIRNDKNVKILPSLVSTSYNHYDIVYHLGALGSAPRSVDYFVESWESNVKKSFKILMNKNYDRLIFTSSSSVYGDQNTHVVSPEITMPQPKNPYAHWKLHVEQIIKLITDKYQIFRLFNIYGPRQKLDPYGAIVPKLCTCDESGEKVKLYNMGENLRCFTYVEDAINLFDNAMYLDTPGTYNLCSIPNKVKKLVQIIGCKNVEYVKENRSVDIEKSIGENSETKRVFGWEPKVSLETGLEITKAYYAI